MKIICSVGAEVGFAQVKTIEAKNEQQPIDEVPGSAVIRLVPHAR